MKSNKDGAFTELVHLILAEYLANNKPVLCLCNSARLELIRNEDLEITPQNIQCKPYHMGWLREKEDILLDLFNFLERRGAIADNYELFKNHFIGDVCASSKLVWFGDHTELLELWIILEELELIPIFPKYAVVITEHFMCEDGHITLNQVYKARNACSVRPSDIKNKDGNPIDYLKDVYSKKRSTQNR